VLPVHIVVLALLGGFVFTTQWYPTRYHVLRSDGYRRIFYSSIAGASLLFFSTVVVSSALSYCPWAEKIRICWHQFIPLDHSGKATIAALLGSSLWIPLNWLGRKFDFLSDKAAVDRAIQRKQNPLEMLLRQALGSKTVVSVTVKNGKVYIGTIQRNFNPAFSMESISIFLHCSGYREKNTMKLRITTDYQATHKKIQDDLFDKFKEELGRAYEKHKNATDEQLMDMVGEKISAEDQIQNYEIVLPIQEIQSINMFDRGIYDEYFRGKA
jgi:hypothetical protein